MVTLPDTCPVSARYAAPTFPVKRFESISGTVARVLYGDRSSGATLDLEFNLPNDRAAEWLDSYEQARGRFDPVALPAKSFEGAQELAGAIPTYITWHFAQPPSVERLTRDRTRVQVQLTGDLEA
jgi:hypothetical protein